jgi:hypothetical protein
MKTKLAVLSFCIAVFIVFGCGKKKENPNAKFTGTYKVHDTWGSSKEFIGSGSLDYDLTITAEGEDGIILNNVNKTLDGIKAKVSGDSIIIKKQTVKSKAGKSYDVDEKTGTVTNNSLSLIFGYDDLDHGDAIGYIYAELSGVKNPSSSEKEE